MRHVTYQFEFDIFYQKIAIKNTFSTKKSDFVVEKITFKNLIKNLQSTSQKNYNITIPIKVNDSLFVSATLHPPS